MAYIEVPRRPSHHHHHHHHHQPYYRMGTLATRPKLGRARQESIIPPSKRKRKELLPPGVGDMCRATWTFDTKLQNEGSVHLNSPLEVLFFPKWSNGAAAMLGSRPLSRHLVHYWEVTFVDRVFGTSMQVGLATSSAALHWERFRGLLGNDNHSWALSHKGMLRHDGAERQACAPCSENQTVTLGLLFNGPQGTLSFWRDGVPLGECFTGLEEVSEDLFPAFASTAARTTMRITARWRSYEDLQDRCRVALRKRFPSSAALGSLPLPSSLRRYVAACYEAPLPPLLKPKDNVVKDTFWCHSANDASVLKS